MLEGNELYSAEETAKINCEDGDEQDGLSNVMNVQLEEVDLLNPF